jgi:limonene 1,2-monooxygenase
MQLAGKYGIGAISVASISEEGLTALPTQWSFAEEAAAKSGKTVDRKDWRVMMAWHLAESKRQAERDVIDGLFRWHNEYRVGVLAQPGAVTATDPQALLSQTGGLGAGPGTTVIGTPDDMIAAIRHIQQVTGGFGVVLGFGHDWANREATLRSWELFARYVIPAINGHTRALLESAEYVHERSIEFSNNNSAAVMAKITLRQQNGKPADAGFRPAAPDLTAAKKSK